MATDDDALPDAPTRLPDFCGAPVLLTLLLLAILVVLVMLFAPGSRLGITNLGTATLFAAWTALIWAVALCKLRPALQRLPPLTSWPAIWLLLVGVTLATSTLVWWLDARLHTGLAPALPRPFILGNTAVAALVGAVLLRYFYVLAQWQERVEAASRAQVEALQARIRPHFLFNSMNTVAALVRIDPDGAERTVEDLSELFRAALAGDDRPATLGSELELLDRYLAIEQLRLGERLRVERDLDAAPRELLMPRLLLQPIVENAVYHGIESRPGGGTVRLAARRDGGLLTLAIDNDRDAGQPARHRGHGMSLRNIRARLAWHYGERARMLVDAGATHYRVTLELPLPEALP